MAHTCNPSTQVDSEFKASMRYIATVRLSTNTSNTEETLLFACKLCKMLERLAFVNNLHWSGLFDNTGLDPVRIL